MVSNEHSCLHTASPPPPLTEDANNLAFHCTLPLIMANFLEYQFLKFFQRILGNLFPEKLEVREKELTQNSFSFGVHAQHIVSDSLFLEFPGLTLFPCF